MIDEHATATDETVIEFFVSAEGQAVRAVQARPDQALGDALASAGIDVEGTAAFVGDDPDDLARHEPSEDDFTPVDLAATVGSLGIGRHGHVTCHRCLRIRVEVNYNGCEVGRPFRAAVTVARVTEWAVRRLGVCEDESDGLVLELCESDDRPRPEQRLGELVRGRECSVCFDLVPKERVNG